MAKKVSEESINGTLNVSLGQELHELLAKAAKDENSNMAAIIRRCLVSSESLRDKYRKRVDEIVRDNGVKWLSGKR